MDNEKLPFYQRWLEKLRDSFNPHPHDQTELTDTAKYCERRSVDRSTNFRND